MKQSLHRLLAGTAVLAVGVGLSAIAPGPVQANQSSGAPGAKQTAAHRPDNRPGPLTKQQDRLRTKALAMLESGDAKLQKRSGGGATVTLKGGPQGVDSVDSFEFPVNRTDQIWTVLAEFGGTGPAHNEIAQPNRTDGSPTSDNSTYWVDDFNQAHYDDLFNGVRRVVHRLLQEAVRRSVRRRQHRRGLGAGAR